MSIDGSAWEVGYTCRLKQAASSLPQSMNCHPDAACTPSLLEAVSASPKRATCCAVQSITLTAGLAKVDGSRAAATARRRLVDFMVLYKLDEDE